MEAALWETWPTVSAGATSTELSWSGASDPGRTRLSVRRGPTSPPGLGEDEQQEDEVGVGATTERPM